MPLIHVNDIQDERLAPFRELKDKSLRAQGLFVVEGRLLAQRLLASSITIQSLLICAHTVEEWRELNDTDLPVYVLPRETISQLVGFDFHRGVLACGIRPESRTLDELVTPLNHRTSSTLLVLPDSNVVENLGALIRSAAAFGVDGLLLGPQCCDPWYRRCVRVSMGNLFNLPLVISQDLHADLDRLHSAYGYTRAGAVLDDSAVSLNHYQRPNRLALLLGNEATGLTAPFLEQLDINLTIPMANTVDSLNIAAAGAVMLYALTQSQ